MSEKTLPDGGLVHGGADQTRIVVPSNYTDERTGQVYVHKDLVLTAPDWAREEHIGPIHRTERFGDVESWANYVARYADGAALLTWNTRGLAAVLDYPLDLETPGRCQWTAEHPFRLSPEYNAWHGFASGLALNQRQAIEKLEDLGEDITEPPQAELANLLRSLRAGASSTAETEIRPDGTTAISFKKDTTVTNKTGTAELPPLVTIGIPVLVGDPQHWGFKVRMRVSVDDNAKLTFRFSLVNAERVLEAVYAEQVAAAQKLLGADRLLLRGDG